MDGTVAAIVRAVMEAIMEVRMIGLDAPPARHFMAAARKYIRDARSWRQLGRPDRAAFSLDQAAAFRAEAARRIAMRPKPFSHNS